MMYGILMEHVILDGYETLFFILKDERKFKYLKTKRSEKYTEYNGMKIANLGYYVMKNIHMHWSHSTVFFFLVAPALEHRAEFPQFLDQGQSVGLLGWVISSSQGLYLYTKRKPHTHTQTLNIHALRGFRTHGPGFQASEDSARLRPLGYRDRHKVLLG
jgi:hypothetical protein